MLCYNNSNAIPADNPIKYCYSELNAGEKAYFGDRLVINLNEQFIEDVEIKIIKILGEDNFVWQYDSSLVRKSVSQDVIPPILLEELNMRSWMNFLRTE